MKNKKILLALTSLTSVAIVPIAAISCNKPKDEIPKDENPKITISEEDAQKLDDYYKLAETFASKVAFAPGIDKASAIASIEKNQNILFDGRNQRFVTTTVSEGRLNGEEWAEVSPLLVFVKDFKLPRDLNLVNPDDSKAIEDGKTNYRLGYELNHEKTMLTIKFNIALYKGRDNEPAYKNHDPVSMNVNLDSLTTEAPEAPKSTDTTDKKEEVDESVLTNLNAFGEFYKESTNWEIPDWEALVKGINEKKLSYSFGFNGWVVPTGKKIDWKNESSYKKVLISKEYNGEKLKGVQLADATKPVDKNRINWARPIVSGENVVLAFKVAQYKGKKEAPIVNEKEFTVTFTKPVTNASEAGNTEQPPKTGDSEVTPPTTGVTSGGDSTSTGDQGGAGSSSGTPDTNNGGATAADGSSDANPGSTTGNGGTSETTGSNGSSVTTGGEATSNTGDTNGAVSASTGDQGGAGSSSGTADTNNGIATGAEGSNTNSSGSTSENGDATVPVGGESSSSTNTDDKTGNESSTSTVSGPTAESGNSTNETGSSTGVENGAADSGVSESENDGSDAESKETLKQLKTDLTLPEDVKTKTFKEIIDYYFDESKDIDSKLDMLSSSDEPNVAAFGRMLLNISTLKDGGGITYQDDSISGGHGTTITKQQFLDAYNNFMA